MDTINDDNALVAGTSTAGNNLSRVAVYASLQSFNNSTGINDRINHDSSRELSPTKPPACTKSSSSSSLLSFYSDLSTIHHRTAPRLDGKNTSARPLGLNDISARLSQRAITFTSKYYNHNSTSENTAKKKKKKKRKKGNPNQETVVSSSYNVSSSQMKRKRQNLIQRINSTNNNNQYDNDYEMIPLELCNLNFLQKLNREWNVYIKNLLQLDNVDISNTPTKRNAYDEKVNHNNNDNNTNEKAMAKVHRCVTALQNNNCIEWVGAFVRISRYSYDKNSTNITLKHKKVRNNDTVISATPVEQEVQQLYHKKQRKANAKAITEVATTSVEGILISHSPNSWMIIPIIATGEASDIDNLNNIDHSDVVDHDIKNKAKHNTSLRTSSITATMGDVTTNATVNDTSCCVQIQNQQKKQQDKKAILLLPKVKIPKQHMVNEASNLIITACIPLDNNRSLSFMDWYSSTTTLMNDETQFLNIHLQSG